MTAKMIPVLKITDANFTSSTIPENDFPVWLVGSTYALAAKVILNHVVYESVQAANTGNDPVTDNLTWWVPLLATNRWSVFDGYIQNQSSSAESAAWVITPGSIVDSVSLFNLAGASVDIVVTDPVEGVVYNQSFALVDNSAIIDAYTYFFSPVITIDNLCATDLPPYAIAAISVTVNAPSGTAKAGQITFGYAEIIGETLDEISLGINDFTRLNEDAFGRTSPVIRGYSRTATPAIGVNAYVVTYLERRLADQRGVPTVWVFDTQFRENELVYLGFYSSYNFLYQFAEISVLDLDIRSLV